MENFEKTKNTPTYQKLKNDLKEILKGKIVIIGIGNPMRGDDAVGNELVERIMNTVKFDCIKCEEVPEDYTADIISKNPDTLLIIDAINLNQNPGDIIILKPEQLKDECFDAHRIPISVFVKYLKNFVKNNVYILGIQPKNISYNSFLSEEVSESIEMLEKLFNDISELKN
jgi:hydrogenase 3 maturation protease